MIDLDKQAISYAPHGCTMSAASPEVGCPTPSIRNQIIRDLMEKAEAEAKDAANSAGIEKHYTWQAQVAWWLKSQLEGGE